MAFVCILLTQVLMLIHCTRNSVSETVHVVHKQVVEENRRSRRNCQSISSLTAHIQIDRVDTLDDTLDVLNMNWSTERLQ